MSRRSGSASGPKTLISLRDAAQLAGESTRGPFVAG